MKYLFIFIFSLLLLFFSCSIEDMFEQPNVEINAFSMTELPADSVYLDIDITVYNNDTRSVHLTDISYQADIEGVMSSSHRYDIDTDMYADSSLDLTLPLTLSSLDAIKCLAKLDSGQTLDYSVTGTFHVDDPILKRLDLPVNVSGTASVRAGYDNFYRQPQITVTDISGDYSEIDTSTYRFSFNVSCYIQNMDSNSVSIDEVTYTVNIEGIQCAPVTLSDMIHFEGGQTDSMDLPVILDLNPAMGTVLAQAVHSGMIDYSVRGLFHVSELNDATADFSLPLFLNDSLQADFMNSFFLQPSIDINGYKLKELPGDSTYLDINMLLTNNDPRRARIADVMYSPVIGGIPARQEYCVINRNISDTLQLTLPVTLSTDDAIQILSVLDAGEELPYSVTGNFHVDDPILNEFDLPIDIRGIASIEIGFEEFYEQPEVTVNSMDGSYRINGFTSYTFDFDADCDIQNMDSRQAEINEVEYVVYVEGVKSHTHYYSHTYDSNLILPGGESENLILPVTLDLGLSQGATLASKVTDSSIDYIIEGIFHVVSVDGTEADFSLPLYVSGSVPATMAVN